MIEKKINSFFQKAGITVNGSQPYDIKVHDTRFYKAIVMHQLLGAGESYMAGMWDCDRLDELTARLVKVGVEETFESRIKNSLKSLWYTMVNQQTKWKSTFVAKEHYNIDYHLYKAMLGETMAYTCAYWKNADNLEAAQLAKFDLICRKLNIKPGQHILDLGCGWGSLAKYMAQRYNCNVTAVNIAEEQVKHGKQICANLPVEIVLADYREPSIYNPQNRRFDHVVSIGMCEHIGLKNYGTFISLARQQIKEDGLFLLHTIGSDLSVTHTNAWTDKYIFPNSMLPSIKQISEAAERRFIIEDLHNFGADYDKTLLAWDKNFVESWPKVRGKLDDTFYRMWRYYLLTSAGAFRARRLQLWQLVLSPHGVPGGYIPVR